MPVRKELMELKEIVKEKYGEAALRVNAGGSSVLRGFSGAG